MYLYKKGDKSIEVYSFVPNKMELIKLKKKYLQDIKSVIVHINNEETHELLFNSPDISFSMLDKKENDDRKTYIEKTENDQIIASYINGEFDSIDPLCIFGDYKSRKKSIYSGDLYNEDCALLFTGCHSYNNEWLTDNGILLTGYLSYFQPLISDNINNVLYPNDFMDLDDEMVDFLKMFNCKKERTIKLDDLKFMQENGLVQINDNFEDVYEKSEVILKSYNKVRKII